MSSQYQPPSHTVTTSPTAMMSSHMGQPPQTMLSPGAAEDLRAHHHLHNNSGAPPQSLSQHDMSRQASSNNNNSSGGGSTGGNGGGVEGISENGSETGGCYSNSLRTTSSNRFDPAASLCILPPHQQIYTTNNMAGNYPHAHTMIKYEMT